MTYSYLKSATPDSVIIDNGLVLIEVKTAVSERSWVMRCAVISRAGQVLANGRLFLHPEEDGQLRLNLRTDGGRLIEGGIVDPDGDLTSASETLFRQFFQVWGMSDLTLTVTIR